MTYNYDFLILCNSYLLKISRGLNLKKKICFDKWGPNIDIKDFFLMKAKRWESPFFSDSDYIYVSTY